SLAPFEFHSYSMRPLGRSPGPAHFAGLLQSSNTSKRAASPGLSENLMCRSYLLHMPSWSTSSIARTRYQSSSDFGSRLPTTSSLPGHGTTRRSARGSPVEPSASSWTAIPAQPAARPRATTQAGATRAILEAYHQWNPTVTLHAEAPAMCIAVGTLHAEALAT